MTTALVGPTTLAPSAGAYAPVAGTKSTTPLLGVNIYFNGPGVLTGTVKEQSLPANTPLRRQVRLHVERDGRPVAETWSDAATGAYSFSGLPMGVAFTVIAYDYEQDYRAVVADNLQAVLP